MIQRQTWKDITTYDDILTPEETAIIEMLETELGLEKRIQCPWLKKEGSHYYYCDSTCGKQRENTPPNQISPIYQSHQDLASLQLWCLSEDGNYRHCIDYPFYEDQTK